MTTTHNSFTQVKTLEHEKLDSQSFEDLKQQSQAHYQELVNDLYNLRRDLHDAEELRDKVTCVFMKSEFCFNLYYAFHIITILFCFSFWI